MTWTQPVTLVAAGLQLSEIQTKVLANAGNIPATHPVWVRNDTGRDFINEAGNRVLLMAGASDRRNFNMFPEMRDWRWDQVTVAGTVAYDLPINLLVPDTLQITRVQTAYNGATDTEYIVTERPIDQFMQLNRAATNTGWPNIWTRAATQLLISPAPVSTPTDYRTRMILYGIKQNAALSGATNRWEMNPLWHPAGVDYATYLLLNSLAGRKDDAAAYLAACKEKITETVNLLGNASRKDRGRIKIAMAPEGRL